jgi:hypothetical protein
MRLTWQTNSNLIASLNYRRFSVSAFVVMVRHLSLFDFDAFPDRHPVVDDCRA